MIIKNMIKCNHCGDIIESKYTHDFQCCKWGRVYVDGGHEYQRIGFTEPDDYTNLSEYDYSDEEK